MVLKGLFTRRLSQSLDREVTLDKARSNAGRKCAECFNSRQIGNFPGEDKRTPSPSASKIYYSNKRFPVFGNFLVKDLMTPPQVSKM